MIARPAQRLLLAGALLVFATASLAGPGDKPKKGKEKDAYALLFATVSDETGHVVPGAQVDIRQKDSNKNHWRVSANGRGEIAVHLPPGPAVYLVDASSGGFTHDTAEASFSGEERQDLSLHISRNRKQEP